MQKTVNVHLALSKIDYLVHFIAKNHELSSMHAAKNQVKTWPYFLNKQGLDKVKFRKVPPNSAEF